MGMYALATSALALAMAGCAQPISGADTGAPADIVEQSQAIMISSPKAFSEAVKAAAPGTDIVLADGVWLDFDAVVDAEGTAEKPITVRAQTPGKVVLSGQSSLRLAGSHIIVSGLVFRDGYTPRAEVISFRRDSDNLAFNSRVTNTVIENYSNPDRAQRDIWVVMYGKNNVFDHNHLSGKLNSGPTMAVRLNTEESQENDHVIRNNYFGPRPVFGSNGGETLRIGTSHYSLSRSGTLVENNYFDRCSGEVEIISNKSGGNTFRGNTFFQSRGTLTLRHGNDTLVENNLFDGDGAPYTGGVRVINARQTIRNNYFKNLTGERFSGALVVMNGVPDSPINRYHQVDGALIEGNSFEAVRRIELAEGSDAERTAVPVNSIFRDNIVVGEADASPFRIQDDLSGLVFEGNVATAQPPGPIAYGFQVVPSSVATDMLRETPDVGISRDETGVSWYPKAPVTSPFDGGARIEVAAGPDALSSALANASAGDTLVLAPGDYEESRLVNLRVPVTIEAADPSNPPVLTFERPNFILLSANGSLRLKGLEVSGVNSPDSSGNSFISTTSMGGAGNHTVELHDMTFSQFDVNKGFSVISAAKGTFYDRIEITASTFSDISGTVIKLDTETDDYGIYNAEYVVIEDSTFDRVGGSVAAVYRGGRDESTFGPHLWVRDSRFTDIGQNSAPLFLAHGVQNLELTGNQISDARPAKLIITTGNPVVDISGNSIAGPEGGSVLNTVDMR
ncbi:chondroitinase-B domain-containing protein [Henriciella sp.]|uniref:chondroitinase-B domain-containing protein n=2 Tax=Hyphomonadaceae TaxID=69657 RepID=UPI003514245C